MLYEQLLASDLAERVAKESGSKSVSLVRLEDLFRPVLINEAIDQSWPNQRQLEAFFAGSEAFIAITNDGEYVTLVSRLSVLNSIVGDVMMEKQNSRS